MTLATTLDYPIIAIGDLHGRADWLAKLVARLESLPEWPTARLVFLGDLGDRCDTVFDAVELVRQLILAKPGSTCVAGNHDHALTRAAGLDGLPPSAYWVERYGSSYDHRYTFESYLGRPPIATHGPEWVEELAALKAAMPMAHKELFTAMPWCAVAEGHLFLHCGLSPEFDCSAMLQVECMHRKIWARSAVQPKLGTKSDRMFSPDYPVWLGADRKASKFPLPYPGKVQVTGHEFTRRPDANSVRIRIDTSGGTTEPLTACVLRSANAPPTFVFSDDPL